MLNLETGFPPPHEKLFKTVKSDVDYFEGEWKCCNVLFKHHVNLDLINDNFDYWWYNVNLLREVGATAVSLDFFKKGSQVFPHTDSDLITSKEIIRMFYPLQKIPFFFSGEIVKGKEVVKGDFETDSPVVFNPHATHSFKAYEDGYYMIIDIAHDKSKLTPEFWESYLSFGLKHYFI